MKIGIPKEYLEEGINQEVKEAILEVAEKYNLSKSYELEKYCYDLYLEKIKQQK